MVRCEECSGLVHREWCSMVTGSHVSVLPPTASAPPVGAVDEQEGPAGGSAGEVAPTPPALICRVDHPHDWADPGSACELEALTGFSFVTPVDEYTADEHERRREANLEAATTARVALAALDELRERGMRDKRVPVPIRDEWRNLP